MTNGYGPDGYRPEGMEEPEYPGSSGAEPGRSAEDTTAADLLWRVLEAEGVRVVFGHPGGAILPIYDALYRHGGIHHVLMRHEQGAAHAADGYARVTGRPGVCMATSGPGATNLVTGLATAQMDSVPLVAITGQVAKAVMGTQAFQETDIVSVARPVTKGTFLVESAEELEPTLSRAFRLALEGRPGPVLVDIPKCVQKDQCAPLEASGRASSEDSGRVSGRAWAAPRSPHTADASSSTLDPDAIRGIDEVARLLARAERPVAVVGRGVVLSRTSPTLLELAERCDLPLITTLLGLDAVPAAHPRCLGMPGMHGTERANMAIQGSDLVLGLGLRFDDRVTGDVDRFAPDAAIVHFDVDPEAPGRTVRADRAVIGDLGATFPALLERVRVRSLPEWWARIGEWRRECGPGDDRDGGDLSYGGNSSVWSEGGPPDGPSENRRSAPLTGRAATRILGRHLGRSGATVVTDVGQHQMWMAQELNATRPRSHLTSGGLGTMGYALPAALGAAMGAKFGVGVERPISGSSESSRSASRAESGASGASIWVVAGDGGLQMTLQELASVVQEGAPLKIAVMNNGFLGMVRQWQELFYDGRYSATPLTGPDWTALAAAYGIPGRAVDMADDLLGAVEWAESTDGPCLLDLRIVGEENVYPMVATGDALDRMSFEPDAAGLEGEPDAREWSWEPPFAKL